jgi:predicted PolB exonuclease-like 3'-5' exonuclease
VFGLLHTLPPCKDRWNRQFRALKMPNYILVWDLATIPDLRGFAAANGHDAKSDDEIRAEMGDKFPKHIYHSIICIGALIAHQDNDHWIVDALGAPHIGERSERELITSFVNRIAELSRHHRKEPLRRP